MRSWLRSFLVAAAVVAVALVAPACDGGAGDEDGGEVLGPGVVTIDMGIEHSRFSVASLRVRQGTAVRFVVHNGDPILHELIVGDDGVHARHRSGNEAAHGAVPGEVSVPPGETASTEYVFDDVGTVRFACHLPRHEAYGMRGAVSVVG